MTRATRTFMWILAPVTLVVLGLMGDLGDTKAAVHWVGAGMQFRAEMVGGTCRIVATDRDTAIVLKTWAPRGRWPGTTYCVIGDGKDGAP